MSLMNARAAHTATTPQPLATAALRVLMRRIATAGDTAARQELHARRRPCALGTDFVAISELIDRTLDAWRSRWPDDRVREHARDLTFDKFWQLPADGGRSETNCQYYYAAVVRYCDEACPRADPVTQESHDAGALTTFIDRHLRLSLYEAARTTRRRQELETKIWPDPEAHAVRDEGLGLPWSVENGLAVFELGEIVAQEKALKLADQRPAIRKLGATQLHALVAQIFHGLSTGELKLARLAREFKLTPSTLTRFAGVHWHHRDARIPDLWVNTARVLSRSPRFRQAAEAAGVAMAVETVRRNAAEQPR